MQGEHGTSPPDSAAAVEIHNLRVEQADIDHIEQRLHLRLASWHSRIRHRERMVADAQATPANPMEEPPIGSEAILPVVFDEVDEDGDPVIAQHPQPLTMVPRITTRTGVLAAQ
jgi:hypothetical protein